VACGWWLGIGTVPPPLLFIASLGLIVCGSILGKRNEKPTSTVVH
jgi:hypothetical protein